jgi:hypothetical protein
MHSGRPFGPQNHLKQMLSDRRQAEQQRAALVERLRSNASHSADGPSVGAPTRSLEHEASVHDADKAQGEKFVSSAPAVQHPRLRFPPKLIADITIVRDGRSIDVPHVAGVIVSTLLASQETSPICILLPSPKEFRNSRQL